MQPPGDSINYLRNKPALVFKNNHTPRFGHIWNIYSGPTGKPRALCKTKPASSTLQQASLVGLSRFFDVSQQFQASSFAIPLLAILYNEEDKVRNTQQTMHTLREGKFALWFPPRSRRLPDTMTIFVVKVVAILTHDDELFPRFILVETFFDKNKLINYRFPFRIQRNSERGGFAYVRRKELRLFGPILQTTKSKLTVPEPIDITSPVPKDDHKVGNDFIPKSNDIGRAQTLYGFEGGINSCYIDSSFFAMFAFNIGFDFIFKNASSLSGTTDQGVRLSLAVSDVLNSLRKPVLVPVTAMGIVREILVEIDPGFLNSFMDAESLILSLFSCMNCTEFYEFDNGATDKVYQIEHTNNRGGIAFSRDVQYLQTLLENSMNNYSILFKKRPFPALILKLPFSKGRPIFQSKFVVPNQRISISTRTVIGEEVTEHLELFGVICLKSCHYVSFAKDEKDLCWYYYNSNPDEVHQFKITSLKRFEADLQLIESIPEILMSDDDTILCHSQFIRFLCSNAYICLYK